MTTGSAAATAKDANSPLCRGGTLEGNLSPAKGNYSKCPSIVSLLHRRRRCSIVHDALAVQAASEEPGEPIGNVEVSSLFLVELRVKNSNPLHDEEHKFTAVVLQL